MKVWLTRIIAIAFVLSLVASPQSALVAAQADIPAATPVVSEPPTVDDADQDVDPVKTEPGDEAEQETKETPTEASGEVEDEATPNGKDQQKPTVDSRVQPLALDDDTTYFWEPWFDGSELHIDGRISPGGVVDPGETLTFTYSNEFLILAENEVSVSFSGPISAVGTAKADQSTGTITLTFADGFEVGEPWAWFWFEIPGSVEGFPECRDLPRGHNNYVELEFGLPFGQMRYQTVNNDEWCEGTGLPNVDWMDFNLFSQQFTVDLEIQSLPPAGHQITITYPADRVTISSGTTNFYLYNFTADEDVLIATGSANEGDITITFLEVAAGEGDDWSSYSYGYFHATLNDAVCDSTGGLYYQEFDEIVFTASSGLQEST